MIHGGCGVSTPAPLLFSMLMRLVADGVFGFRLISTSRFPARSLLIFGICAKSGDLHFHRSLFV